MRLFAAPDVNGPRNYYPDNETMLEGNLHTFRTIFRDIEFTVLSSDSGPYSVEPRQGPRHPNIRF